MDWQHDSYKVNSTALKKKVSSESTSIAFKMNVPPGNGQPLPRLTNEKVLMQREGGGNMSLLPN